MDGHDPKCATFRALPDSFDAEVHKYYDLRDTERPVDAFSDQIAANAIDEGVNAKAVAVQAKRQGFRLER